MQGPLVRDARFAPMFWTQALGAFNDNLFKNALVIGITYGGVEVFGIEPSKIAAPASALFMLPFFLFSATAGQLADKLEKSQLIRATKLMEIAIMAVAGVGFLLAQYELLLVLLFLMGTQSALFGPVKYGILPQLVDEDDLVSGNALVELATYLAILTGTIAGGVIVGATIGGVAGSTWLGVALLAVALLGWWQSRQIPEAPAENPTLEVQWDPIRPTIEILGVTRANRPIWLAALGISWFWGLGTMLLAVFPSYTLDVLGADEHIATLFLAAFSIGIGAGSMLCERLSKHRLELGVVPIGSFFMSVFLVDLWLLDIPWEPNPEALLTLGDFLATGTGLHIVADLVGFAMAGGLYIVPLYTYLQQRAQSSERSRVIAGMNIVSAAVMVVASLLVVGLQAMEVSIAAMYAGMAVLNVLVAAYIYTVVPEFMLRFFAWMLSNVLYRVKVEGLDNVPTDGAAVVVANHVTYVDWLVLGGAIKRPLRFVMDASFAKTPVIGTLSRQAGVIPIVSAKRDPDVLARAMEQIHDDLDEGWVLGLFPEGTLTPTGDMLPFRPGIERILARDPVPVVPVALNGLWGSWFSRQDGEPTSKRPSRFWSRVSVTIGEPIPPEEATAERLQQAVQALWEKGEP